MHKLLSEDLKVDVALASRLLNGAAIGQYHSMGGYRRALFVISIGDEDPAVGIIPGATAEVEVWEAQDAAGTGGVIIGNLDAEIDVDENATIVLIEMADPAPDAVVVVNGITFTGRAAGESIPDREWDQDTTNDNRATSLAACINDPVFGVPGVTAAAAAAVVTLTATEPGEETLTVVGVPTDIDVTTVAAVGYLECHASFLDVANGFSHIALRVNTSLEMAVGAVLLRGSSRYGPIQQVAASKTDLSP